MQDSSRSRIDEWWADLFGVPLSMLWQPGVTVGFHARLGSHPGIVVAGRDEGVHVSLPDWADAALAAHLGGSTPDELLDIGFWKGLASIPERHVVGPVVHGYTDVQLDEPAKVEVITAGDIAGWADVVSRRRWQASGFAGDVGVVFAIRSGEEVAAAANLTPFLGAPTDVGVLTHPKFRGKGYTKRVAAAATAYAVRSHGIARYRAAMDDERARSIGKALGFEEYCVELTVVPMGDGGVSQVHL